MSHQATVWEALQDEVLAVISELDRLRRTLGVVEAEMPRPFQVAQMDEEQAEASLSMLRQTRAQATAALAAVRAAFATEEAPTPIREAVIADGVEILDEYLTDRSRLARLERERQLQKNSGGWGK